MKEATQGWWWKGMKLYLMAYTDALDLNHSLECEKWWLMRNNSY